MLTSIRQLLFLLRGKPTAATAAGSIAPLCYGIRPLSRIQQRYNAMEEVKLRQGVDRISLAITATTTPAAVPSGGGVMMIRGQPPPLSAFNMRHDVVVNGQLL